MKTYSIPHDFQLGPVSLTVNDLDRSIRFYQEMIGLRLKTVNTDGVLLTSDESPLIHLTENSDAIPGLSRNSGLYHFAFLCPVRAYLGRVLRRLRESEYPLGGCSDHGVSEALYFDDPDGHGIELYWDRPRDLWKRVNGDLKMSTDPLDLTDILREKSSKDGEGSNLLAGLILGHVHLHVRDLIQAETFYADVLGFKLQSRVRDCVSFFSVGDYHHHIGINVWEERKRSFELKNSVRMNFIAITLPKRNGVERLVKRLESLKIDVIQSGNGILFEDPSENRIVAVDSASLDGVLSFAK